MVHLGRVYPRVTPAGVESGWRRWRTVACPRVSSSWTTGGSPSRRTRRIASASITSPIIRRRRDRQAKEDGGCRAGAGAAGGGWCSGRAPRWPPPSRASTGTGYTAPRTAPRVGARFVSWDDRPRTRHSRRHLHPVVLQPSVSALERTSSSGRGRGRGWIQAQGGRRTRPGRRAHQGARGGARVLLARAFRILGRITSRRARRRAVRTEDDPAQHTPGVLTVEPSQAWDPITLGGVGVAPPERLAQFYRELHAYLAAAGVDGIKVDGQAVVGGLGGGVGGAPRSRGGSTRRSRRPRRRIPHQRAHQLHVSLVGEHPQLQRVRVGARLGRFLPDQSRQSHRASPTSRTTPSSWARSRCRTGTCSSRTAARRARCTPPRAPSAGAPCTSPTRRARTTSISCDSSCFPVDACSARDSRDDPRAIVSSRTCAATERPRSKYGTETDAGRRRVFQHSRRGVVPREASSSSTPTNPAPSTPPSRPRTSKA